MLSEAVRWGSIPTNPAAAVRPPRVPPAKLHVPDADVCDAIRERSAGRAVEGPIIMALGSGERLGEILGARWDDVDLEGGVVRVTSTLSYPSAGTYVFAPPKTSRARRSIDLPPFVVAFLKRHRREQLERRMALRDVWIDTDVVFDDGIGQPMSPWVVGADFRRIVRELGLPRITFHSLRHSHATQLLAAGVNVKAISERLGHSSTAFTMDVYAAWVPSMGREAADAAERVFGGGRR
jgi:integrase